jgi:hypothetical protein
MLVTSFCWADASDVKAAKRIIQQVFIMIEN